jgi:hypothetical protein
MRFPFSATLRLVPFPQSGHFRLTIPAASSVSLSTLKARVVHELQKTVSVFGDPASLSGNNVFWFLVIRESKHTTYSG